MQNLNFMIMAMFFIVGLVTGMILTVSVIEFLIKKLDIVIGSDRDTMKEYLQAAKKARLGIYVDMVPQNGKQAIPKPMHKKGIARSKDV